MAGARDRPLEQAGARPNNLDDELDFLAGGVPLKRPNVGAFNSIRRRFATCAGSAPPPETMGAGLRWGRSQCITRARISATAASRKSAGGARSNPFAHRERLRSDTKRHSIGK